MSFRDTSLAKVYTRSGREDSYHTDVKGGREAPVDGLTTYWRFAAPHEADANFTHRFDTDALESRTRRGPEREANRAGPSQ